MVAVAVIGFALKRNRTFILKLNCYILSKIILCKSYNKKGVFSTIMPTLIYRNFLL